MKSMPETGLAHGHESSTPPACWSTRDCSHRLALLLRSTEYLLPRTLFKIQAHLMKSEISMTLARHGPTAVQTNQS